VTLVQADPTWALEYAHFTTLCRKGGPGTLVKDEILNRILGGLAHEASGTHPRRQNSV
jgi:hypothetical protein